jgi:6-phosphofructokinase 2
MAVVTVTLNPCIDKTLSVERVVPDQKLGARDVRTYPGGGGLNVARAIHALGGEVCALWSQGGMVGDRLEALIDAEAVPQRPVPIAGEVRENLIVSETSSSQQYRFSLRGPELCEDERARWRRSVEEVSGASFVVFSGSLPRDAPVAWYAELIEAVPDGARVVVDSKEAALARACEAGVHLVKPNLHELEQLVGRELSDDDAIEEAASEIVERGGAEIVLVSLGRGGAIVVDATGCEQLAAPSVPLRSKIGAGDSMVGATVLGLDRGWSVHDAAAFGVAAGAAAVMNPGTELCRREDADRLYERMKRKARAGPGSTDPGGSPRA